MAGASVKALVSGSGYGVLCQNDFKRYLTGNKDNELKVDLELTVQFKRIGRVVKALPLLLKKSKSVKIQGNLKCFQEIPLGVSVNTKELLGLNLGMLHYFRGIHALHLFHERPELL